MKATEEKVIRFIDERSLISPREKLLVALSGGPDSVFLLTFFFKFRQRFQIELCALHINHQLRGGDSDLDEEFCKSLCEKLNIEFSSESVDIKKLKRSSKKSIEEIARDERYKLLDKYLKIFAADKIATAHNQDDNTETVLLNLIKGTGAAGLSGIPVKRGKIIRPILCLSKNEILTYLKKKNIEYRIDKSNFSNDYQRNILRNKVIPQIIDEINPAFHSSVFRTSKNISSLNKAVNSIASEVGSKLWVKRKQNVNLKLSELSQLDSALAAEVIKFGLKKYYDEKVTSADISKINNLITMQVGKQIKLRKGFIGIRERNKIILRREIAESPVKIRLNPGEDVEISGQKISIVEVPVDEVKMNQKGVEYVSIDDTNPEFVLTNWQSGDKFQPLGMKNFKKVSDFLTDLKIPAHEKKSKLVLKCRNQIVYIVGLRIDNRFKITDQSKKVYKICLK